MGQGASYHTALPTLHTHTTAYHTYHFTRLLHIPYPLHAATTTTLCSATAAFLPFLYLRRLPYAGAAFRAPIRTTAARGCRHRATALRLPLRSLPTCGACRTPTRCATHMPGAAAACHHPPPYRTTCLFYRRIPAPLVARSAVGVHSAVPLFYYPCLCRHLLCTRSPTIISSNMTPRRERIIHDMFAHLTVPCCRATVTRGTVDASVNTVCSAALSVHGPWTLRLPPVGRADILRNVAVSPPPFMG